ncbi:MAG: flippase [Candidatus Gastranaerophilales bacterium]|nr:flippase [Candidatus Gastranaerophilales bacterium]
MKLIKNYIYNLLFQASTLLLPLITVPYVSRVLGSNGVGIAEYTTAISMYFVIFAQFGIYFYGTRTIAYYRDDVEKRNSIFWDLTYMKFIFMTVSIALFLIMVLFFDKRYFAILLILVINILSVGFEISWFFNGMEDMQKVAVRNIASRTIGTALIFILVKTPNDVWIYVMIFSLTGLISNIILWKFLKEHQISYKPFSFSGVKKHAIASSGLFLSSMIAIIYSCMDKTVLGSLVPASEVGHYSMASKLLGMSIGFVSCLGTVMLPRIANVFAQGDIEQVKYYTATTFNFMLMFSIYIAAGFLGASAEFVPWFLGSDFLPAINLLYILSFTVILIVMTNVFGTQLLIPMGREKDYVISQIVGIVFLLIFSLTLVPKYHAVGTCISMVISSFIIVLYRYCLLKDILPHKAMFSEVWKYVAGGITVVFALRYIGSTMGIGAFTTCAQIAAASIIYLAILFVFKASILNVIYDKLVKKMLAKVKVKAVND